MGTVKNSAALSHSGSQPKWFCDAKSQNAKSQMQKPELQAYVFL